MSAVVKAVSNVISSTADAVGKVGQSIIDTGSKALSAVDDAAHDVVNAAIQDPIGTIAKVAAVATGQFELLPVISAADTIAHGGDLGDAAKSAAISYAAQGVGNYVGGQLGTSLEYGTDLGSAQTAQLAAQSGNMLGGTTSGTIGGAAGAAAAGATAGVLSGGNVDQAIINALGNYAARTGIGYTFNAAGQLVDQAGKLAPSDVQSEIASTADAMRTDNPTVIKNLDGTYTQTFDDGTKITFSSSWDPISTTNTEGDVIDVSTTSLLSGKTDLTSNPTIVKNQDGTYTQTFDDGSTQTFDENLKPISATTYDGEVIYPSAELQPSSGEGTDIAPENNLSGDALLKYFQNQFASSLASQLLKKNIPSYTATSPMSGGTASPTAGATERQTFGPQDVGYNVGTQAELASILPQDYFAEKKSEDTTDPFSADAAEYAKQKYMESQFYDAPTEYAAAGGPIGHNPQFFSEGGAGIQHRYVKGDGDGTSDSVPAMLASGEFVIPADVVSSLGNGDNDAGASVLDKFMQQIRSHKRSANPDQLPPDSKGPLSYLKEANKKVKKHGRS